MLERLWEEARGSSSVGERINLGFVECSFEKACLEACHVMFTKSISHNWTGTLSPHHSGIHCKQTQCICQVANEVFLIIVVIFIL